MDIKPTAKVAEYMELENSYNQTLGDLNTSFGGAISSIFSYDPNEKTVDKFSNNNLFIQTRLAQVGRLQEMTIRLEQLVREGVVAEVHAYYAEKSKEYRGE
jgi:hypothetical protein